MFNQWTCIKKRDNPLTPETEKWHDIPPPTAEKISEENRPTGAVFKLKDEAISSEERKENNRRMEERQSIRWSNHKNRRLNTTGKIPMKNSRQYQGKVHHHRRK
ncbi:hypothetical protein F2Q68_00016014 [Brassica cretica]|uniref:Uncharacterized protein n=1 Tax=Brassica cretica TaxID=69181 RepID=A0A8S9HE14_BRACR|nr:hypothetical protein F2Q68_00016014 [Brassica cretica]